MLPTITTETILPFDRPNLIASIIRARTAEVWDREALEQIEDELGRAFNT